MKVCLRHFLILAVIILVHAIGNNVRAATITATWTGAISTDWNTAGNWNIGLVPSNGGGDDYIVIIPSGLTNYPTLGTNSFTIRALTSMGNGASLSGTGTLSMSANTTMTITGTASISCLLNFNAVTANFVMTNASDLLTIAGAISGTNSFTKSGLGILILAGDNSYSGTLTVDAGTLKLGANGSATSGPLGTTASSTIVSDGATFDLNGFTLGTAEGISLRGIGVSRGALTNTGGDASFSGAITLAAATTIIATTSGTLTLSGNCPSNQALTLGGSGTGLYSGIKSSNSIVKTGTGTWTLSGLNTYTGTTTVTAGVLRAENNTVAISTNGPFGNNASGLILNGGTIQTNVATFSRPITVAATNSGLDAYGLARTISSAITLGTAGTFNLNIGGTTVAGADGQKLTLSGIISNTTGTLGITKIGTSTAILSGTNSYVGTTTVSAGILRANTTNVVAGTNGPFGNNPNGLNLNGGTIQSNVAIFSRPITVTATNSSLDAYELARTIISNITLATAGTFNLNIGGTTAASAEGQELTLSGIISNTSGTLGLTKIGSSTAILSGSNSYTGSTTVSAGILRATTANVLASINGAFGNNASGLNLNGGTIQSNVVNFSRPITVTATNSGLDAYGLTRTVSAPITLASAGTFNLNIGGTTAAGAEGQDLTLSGVIANSSGILSLTKIGTSKLILSGTNTFTGGVTLNSGTLNIENNQALGTIAGTFTIAGGTIDASGAGISTLNYPLTLNADFTFTGTNSLNLGTGTVSMNGDRQITVSANTLTLGGTISQAASTLTKAGAGILSFGSNTVTLNGLSISAGTLTSTSGTLNLAGNFSNSGTFTPNGGTVNYNGSSQTIAPVTYNNLTISQSAGNATLGANATVNGILNLSSGNLAVTDPFELTMGGSATTIGAKDVTGIVTRTSFLAGIAYTFGNQYTTMNFQNVGTLPSEVSVKITIGSAPLWKPDAILRSFDMHRIGGSGAYVTIQSHYLDAELNGNNENNLVWWRGDSPFTPGSGVEAGRTNYDLTNNWITLSSAPIEGLPTDFGQRNGALGTSALTNSTWNGSVSTDWVTSANWSPQGVPSDLTNVVIPDASTTLNDPTLGLSTALGRLTLQSGAILNAIPNSTVTISGSSGAWLDNGGTFNASTSNVVFTNAAATIGGITGFYNLTINSGAALTMAINTHTGISGTVINNGIWNVAENTGTTVVYDGGNQTILIPNGTTPGYRNLVLSGTGTKTMQPSTGTVNGNFSMSGTAALTATAAINTTGNFTIGIGSSFTAGAFTHTVGGNFSNAGTFTGTGSTFNFNGTGAQTINNANTWYNLSITGTAARTVTFQSGVAQTVTNSLTLTGASGQLLSLVPSASPTKWQLNAPATQSVSYVSASYSDASSGTAISANNGTNVNNGSNLNWNFSAQTTPTFSPAAGAIAFGTTVTISSGGADAIYYTTDGTDPTIASTNQATTPLVINSAVTVKALAVKAGSPNSAIGSAIYTQSATADLTGLVLSGSPTNYTYSSGTYTYNDVRVPYAISSITITPTGLGNITVDGTTVSSGTASAAINLTSEVQKAIVIVATETGKSPKTYTINVTRAPSTAKEISTFTIMGNGTVNEIAKTIAVTVPCGTSVTALVASFTTTGTSVKIGAVSQTSGVTANNFSSPVTYTVTAIDATTQDYVVTVTVAPDPSKAITAFTILGNGTVNETAKTIAVSLPFGTNVSALVASFSTTGISVEVGATHQTSGTTVNNFSSPLTYTVTAADATTQNYVVTVTVAGDPAKAITAFTILGTGTVTENSKTIAVTLPNGTDVSALVASFTTTGASVKVGGVIQISGTTSNNFSSPVTYTVTSGDGTTEDYVVTVSVTTNTSKAITAFAILGNGTINESTKTIAVALPHGTDLTALAASFTTTGASVKVGLITQSSGTTLNNFSLPVTYTVTAQDGTTQDYVVTVSVVSNSAKAITSFTILGTGTVNENAKTITAVVPFGTDLSTLVANFTATGSSVRVGGVIQISGTTTNNFSSPVTYTVTSGDGTTQDYVITVSVTTNTSKAITAFVILGNGSINESAKTIAVILPYGTNPTALAASFTSTGASVKVGGIIQTSGTTVNNFSNAVTYTVTAADASTQDYLVRVSIETNPLTPGSIGSDQLVCEGFTAPLAQTVAPTGGSGIYTYQWQKSIVSSTTGFSNIEGATGIGYAPGTLSQTTWYKRLVSSNGFAPSASNIVTITVVPPVSHNLINGPSILTFCQSGDPGLITGSIPNGGNGSYTYQWKFSTEESTCMPIPGATSIDFNPGVVTKTTQFRREVISGNCVYLSNTIIIVVTQPLIDNIISGNQTIDSGKKPEALTGAVPSGGDSKKVYLWESSTLSDTSGFVPAAGINNEQNYSPEILTQTTFFRRKASSGVCPIKYSNSVKIMLKQVTVGIPEGFSPNGDGVNDLFVIENLNNEKISLQIFNSLGALVFRKDDYKNDWDGLSNQGSINGMELPNGTYFYVVSKRDNTENYVSFITLTR